MPAHWNVHVAGQTYGPFSDDQMTTFASEGRLAQNSLVARAGGADFHAAGSEPGLLHLFGTITGSNAENSSDSSAAQADVTFGRNRDESQKLGEEAQIVIIADMKSRSIDALEDEIAKMGRFFSLLPQVWLLRTTQTVNSVRNRLTPQLGKLDRLFVVDTTNNKAAWFNFGPEIETRVRRVWSRKTEPGPRTLDRSFDYHA